MTTKGPPNNRQRENRYQAPNSNTAGKGYKTNHKKERKRKQTRGRKENTRPIPSPKKVGMKKREVIKQAWMEQKNHHGTDAGLATAITATDSTMEVSTFG